MTIYVQTAEYGLKEFDADDWDVRDGNYLWVGNGDIGVAEFASGAWLFVFEVVEPEQSEPRVWQSINDVPEGVTVLDKDDDEFSWARGALFFYDCPWGRVGAAFDRNLGPFTEKGVA